MRYVTVLAYTKEEADPIFFKFVKNALKKMGIKYTGNLESRDWFNRKCGESELEHSIPITETQYKNHKILIRKILDGYLLKEDGKYYHGGDFPDRDSNRVVSESSYTYKLRNKANDIAYIIKFIEFYDSHTNPQKYWSISFTQRYKKTPPKPPKRTKLSADLKAKAIEFAQSYYKRVNTLVKRHNRVGQNRLCDIKDNSTNTAVHFLGLIKENDDNKGRALEKGLVGSGERLGYRFRSRDLGYKAVINKIDNIEVDGYIFIKYDRTKNGVEVEFKVENVCKP